MKNKKEELKEWIEIDAQKCPYTWKMYDAYRWVKCTCDCHDPNKIVMHFMPCCENGMKKEFRYID